MIATWSPMVKLLLAVSEREPISGGDLISYLVQQYRMSTHTYVKARQRAISQGLIQWTPTGKKGRSAQYSLTSSGRDYLDGLGELLKDDVKGFASKKYWFKFGEDELGRIDFSVKSNLPSPLLLGSLYREGIITLLLQNLSDHFIQNIKLKEDKKIDVETEINVKISAKGVDKEVVYAMRQLHDAEEKENLEDPNTIMEIDKLIAENPTFQDVLRWHLFNVYGQSEPEFDEEIGEDWWLAPLDWKILNFDHSKSVDPISCDYWGSFIFERKEEAVRDLEEYFLFSGARYSDLLELRNVLVINRQFLGSDLDDYTFLGIWEKARTGLPASLADYEQDLFYRPFHVLGLYHLIDREIYKKWILRSRPRNCQSYDITSFLIAVLRKAFPQHKKETRKTWAEISRNVLKYAEDYLRQTRFDIIEKSHG